MPINKIYVNSLIDPLDGQKKFYRDLDATHIEDVSDPSSILGSIKSTADTAKTIAEGATRAMVFDTIADMEVWLKNSANKGKLKIGDNLYIKAIDVPDFWVSAVYETATPEGFYYNYSRLEIGQVKLSNVVTTDADQSPTIDTLFGALNGTSKRITFDAFSALMAATLMRRTRKTDFDLNVLKLAVADQCLEKYGLKVGDQKTINGRTYVIAGLNPMKGSQTPNRVTANHVGLIVIPHINRAWNESGNTYTGAGGRGAGYANCDLHAFLKETVLPWCQADLGSGNLIARSMLLSNAINTTGYNRWGTPTGCSSGWAWVTDQYIVALSEVQVYGTTIWSSSGFDTGEACRQLDVFRVYNHTEIFGYEFHWFRDVASASNACDAAYNGDANFGPASYRCFVSAFILFH